MRIAPDNSNRVKLFVAWYREVQSGAYCVGGHRAEENSAGITTFTKGSTYLLPIRRAPDPIKQFVSMKHRWFRYGGAEAAPFPTMKAGVPPVAAGYVVSFFAIILLLFGMYFLLRTLGVGVALSVCGAILVLSSETVQFLLETIRSDALATALHIWGLFFCLSPIRKGWHLPAAAACFSLAFATKATSAIGLVAGFLILFLARRKRESFKLVAGTAVGCLAVLGFMYLGSTGRALEIIRKCASGGYPPIGIFRGSAFGLRLAWTNDHAGFLLFFLVLATLLSLPRSSWKNTPTVLFVIFLGATIFIYAYLSQDENHLLDLVVASVVLAIPPLASSDEPDRAQRAGFRLGLLALIALLATGWVLRSRRDFQILPKKRDRLEAFRILHHVSSPVLAENPLIPVLLGQRAYVADPYMFGVLRKQDPSFAQPLLTKMRKHEFDAIVLFHDRQTAEGRDILITAHSARTSWLNWIAPINCLPGPEKISFTAPARESPFRAR